jgi:hypothetical protein
MTLTKMASGAVAFLLFASLGGHAQAAPFSSWFTNGSSPATWYANQAYQNGGFYAPGGSLGAQVVASNWYDDPSYRSSLGLVKSVASNPSVAVQPVSSLPPQSFQPAPSPIYQVATAPAYSTFAMPAAAPASTQTEATAFINFGNAPYANASTLTSGTEQPWYTSPAVVRAYSGTPTSDQQAGFVQNVLSDIEHTFKISGMNVSLTADPTLAAAHEMSVVSGVSYPGNTSAIGITTVGSNGFGFIDKLNYANNPDDLAMAVAHNLSHELMHALGVASHPDQSGQYLDSATATWSMLTDPNTKFSPEAVQMMLSANGGSSDFGSSIGAQLLNLSHHSSNCHCAFCQMLHDEGLSTAQLFSSGSIDGDQTLVTPVPEPSTIALWGVVALGGLVAARRRTSRGAN